MNKQYITIIILLGVAVIGFLGFSKSQKNIAEKGPVTNFEECARGGRPVMESYPRQCNDGNGHVFVEIIDKPVTPPTPVSQENTVKFSTEYSMKIGERVSLPDGLTVTLVKINDSRCPKNVQCIWAGELAPVLSVTGGFFGSKTQEINIGTVKNQSDTVGGYTFAIRSATTESANIVVYRGISN